MKIQFHDSHFSWLLFRDNEFMIFLGFASGRVGYEPEAKWLYSFRLFLVFFRLEILWRVV